MEIAQGLTELRVKAQPPVDLLDGREERLALAAVHGTSEELPQLFSRFFRASNATRSSIAGTGLGLAIARAIAEAHNSVITVQSTVAQGTTFRLQLPARSSGRDRSYELNGQDTSAKLAKAVA